MSEQSPIVAACSCGQRFRVRPELAGRQAKCPKCKQIITIPTVDEPDPDDFQLDSELLAELDKPQSPKEEEQPTPTVDRTGGLAADVTKRRSAVSSGKGCPACGSENVRKTLSDEAVAFQKAHGYFFRRPKYCRDCGHMWQAKTSPVVQVLELIGFGLVLVWGLTMLLLGAINVHVAAIIGGLVLTTFSGTAIVRTVYMMRR